MVHSSKKKILSILLSLCMIGSMFTLPMMANASSLKPGDVIPTFHTQGGVINNATESVPAGAAAKADTSPFAVVYNTATTTIPYSSLVPASGTYLTFYSDNNFTSTTNPGSTFGVDVGTVEGDGSVTGGTTYYFTISDSNDNSIISYNAFTLLRVKSTAKALIESDPNSVVASYSVASTYTSPDTASFADASLPTINLVLKSTASNFPIANFSKSTNATLNFYTNSDGTGAADDPLVAGTYYVKVTAEDGTAAYSKLVVSVQTIASTDTSLKVTMDNAIAYSTTSLATAQLPADQAYASGTSANPTVLTAYLQAGTYSVTNVSDALLAANTNGEAVSLYSDSFGGTSLSSTFSTTLNSGDTFSIYAVTTAVDTSKKGYFEIIYKVYPDNGITSAKTLPNGSSVSSIPLTPSTSSSAPSVINVNLKAGTASVDLTNAFNSFGAIEYNTKVSFDVVSDVTGNNAFATGVGTTTVYARIKTTAWTADKPVYYFYQINFIRPAVSAVNVISNGGTDYSVTNSVGANIDSLAGSTDSANPTVVNIVSNGSGSVNAIIAAAVHFDGSNYATDTFINPVLTSKQSFTVNVTETSDNGTVYNFRLNVSVADTSIATISGTGIAVSGASIVGGAASVPVGSVDPNYLPTVTIQVPSTYTAIKAADFVVPNLGTLKLFASQADLAGYWNTGDTSKVVGADGIAISNESTTVYAAVLSQDGSIKCMYQVVIDTVNTAAKYKVLSAGFTATGANYIANISIDRNTAAKLTNPKLYVVYTFQVNGQQFQTFETKDLTNTDTSTSAQLVVSKNGFVSATIYVVDGSVNWGVSAPAIKSNLSTLIAPVA